MKKIATIIIALALGFAANAQSIDDALLISSNNYTGTARTMAMGNAFTALGGDIGALVINPAASGVMRSSQFEITAGNIRATSNIGGSKDRFSNFEIPSVGFIESFDTGNRNGLFYFNFGMAVNSRNTFNSVASVGTDTDKASYLSSLASNLAGVHYSLLSNENPEDYYPFNNPAVTWPEILAWNTYVLATTPDSETDYMASTENTKDKNIFIAGPLAQDYYRKRDGGITDITLNLGGNFNDELFFGVNLNISDVEYNVTESYAEAPHDPSIFQDGLVSYAQQYSQQTTGTGINAQFGIIYSPYSVPGLRVGATYTTRTSYDMNDSWRYFAQSAFNNGHAYSMDSPAGTYNYVMKSPSRFSLGAAYVLDDDALISFDIESINYRNIRYSEVSGDKFPYTNLNDQIKNSATTAYVSRLGFEWWLGDCFAVRFGQNHYSRTAEWAQERNVYSYGAGIKFSEEILFDIAFQHSKLDSDFQMYNNYSGGSVPTFDATNKLNKLMFSLTCKF